MDFDFNCRKLDVKKYVILRVETNSWKFNYGVLYTNNEDYVEAFADEFGKRYGPMRGHFLIGMNEICEECSMKDAFARFSNYVANWSDQHGLCARTPTFSAHKEPDLTAVRYFG